jgi:aldose 1-epimerase
MSPSGEQVVLEHGDYRATVVEVGGGLRTLEHAGAAVLDGYPEDQMASAGRGALLVPWPNRLHGGRYTWDGVTGKAALNEPDQQNAIHGLARYRSWVPTDRTDSSVTMRLLLRPQPAYPFTVSFAARYELGDDGLAVTMSTTNEGDRDAPYGSGAHPYLTVGTERVDGVVLGIPARSWIPTGTSQLPLDREPVEDTQYDFREPRPVGKVRMDHGFTDLQRGSDGRAVVSLAAPSGRRVELWVDEGFGYVQVFTGDTLPGGARRRSAAVEPMTCPPDAFRSGEDVIRLTPGATTSAGWGIRAG